MKEYKSSFYKKPIKVENIEWEILVKIYTKQNKEIIYSWYDLIDKTSYSPYIKNAILSSFLLDIPKNILILGFWAWSYAKYFKDYLWEKINIVWVEIDDTMINIAKNEFNLENINYFNLDYLEALKILNNKNKKFDIIFIDLYDEDSKIPTSLNNTKNIKNIIQLLNKNWELIVNFANYKENYSYYKEIEEKIIQNLINKEYFYLLNWENDYWNVIWVYNLKEKFDKEKLILSYLEKVQNWLINYDSNLITKIFLKNNINMIN